MIDERPVGVNVVHQYYPGFIDLIPNALFLVDSDDLRGGVHLADHVRPLVVTDYQNEIVRENASDGLVRTRIARPIVDIDEGSTVVDATGLEGRSAPALAIEQGTAGRVFYQDVYTELLTFSEFREPDGSDGLVSHSLLVNRFVGTYRYLNPDPRLQMPMEIPIETTPLRVGSHTYSDQERSMPFAERISNIERPRLYLSIAAIGHGVRSLIDHNVSAALLETRSRNVNAWLCNGFSLTENLVELERLVDLAFTERRYRAAIVEAVAILEVGLLQARDRVTTWQTKKAAIRKASEDVTLKFLVETVLPFLLKSYDGDIGALVCQAKRVRDVRNDIVHKHINPTIEDANTVLSCVRNVLTILELPEQFRGNYKARP